MNSRQLGEGVVVGGEDAIASSVLVSKATGVGYGAFSRLWELVSPVVGLNPHTAPGVKIHPDFLATDIVFAVPCAISTHLTLCGNPLASKRSGVSAVSAERRLRLDAISAADDPARDPRRLRSTTFPSTHSL